MTTQCRDKLTNQFYDINFAHYEVSGIYMGKLNARANYLFSCKPLKVPGVINSSCWKGYVAHFRLNASGTLVLEKYVDLAGNDQPVDEELCGKFWLELEAFVSPRQYGYIYVPFVDGKIVADSMKWEGDPKLLRGFRTRCVEFSDYSEALSFLKRVAAGLVAHQPFGDGFLWDSEGENLNETQIGFIDAHNLRTSIWPDPDTGLAWIFDPGSNTKSRRNLERFGGYDNWRAPSLRELKTLSGNEKDQFGIFVKPELSGTVRGMFLSSTPYFRRNRDDEGAIWDFANGRPVEQHYHEGSTKWGSEGGFAGFESSGYSFHPRKVLVAGRDSRQFPAWAESLIEWAEANEIHSFPVTAETIAGLEHFTLPGDRLPEHFSMLTNLRTLRYPKCALLEEGLFSLEKLEELILGGRILGSKRSGEFIIPEGISQLANLKSLTVQELGIKKLPPSIGNLTSLRSLKIFGTELESLPESLCNLERLEELSLRCNKLGRLPESIIRLGSIKSLDISHNGINQLPDGFGRLAKLATLEADGNDIRALPESFSNLAGLETLSLSKCKLDVLPDGVRCLGKLKSLDVSFNAITKLPEWIGDLHELCKLNIAAMQITELPESLKRLGNLEHINVSGTALSRVPEWLGEMDSLKMITVAKMPNIESKQGITFEGKKVNYYFAPLC